MKVIPSGLDGKIQNWLLGVSNTRACPICELSTTDLNLSFDEVNEIVSNVNIARHLYGIRPLHMAIGVVTARADNNFNENSVGS